jgi:hypothetical protein
MIIDCWQWRGASGSLRPMRIDEPAARVAGAAESTTCGR